MQPDSRVGWLLLAATLLSLATSFGAGLFAWLPGVLLWLCGLMLFPLLGRLQRTQVLLMLSGGVLAAVVGWQPGHQAPLLKALAGNHGLIAMLVSVSFLRLIAPLGDQRRFPRGPRALLQTLLGVHIFGAVINLSALFIMGDQLARRDRLSRLQAITLSRGFSLAAHWSPFFVAMGVALTQAPGSSLPHLALTGLLPAAIGLLLAWLDLRRQPGAGRMRGYPMHPKALRMPIVLACAVILAHQWLPDTGIVALVSALALGGSLLVLSARGSTGWQQFRTHVGRQLPRMGGEVCLFLAAAVLSAGIGMAAEGLGLKLQGMELSGLLAGLLLAIVVGLAVAGIHPLISITTLSGLLQGAADPDLLAMLFLMCWALGVSASPFSGMHVAMQGRYGVPSWRFMGWNGRFVAWMLAVDWLVLAGYDLLSR